MDPIAVKFVPWETKPLETLQGCFVYQLRNYINQGGKLNRAQRDWITEKVNKNAYFCNGIPLQGYFFCFADVLKRFCVKHCGQVREIMAVDKTAIRKLLPGKIDYIVEVPNV